MSTNYSNFDFAQFKGKKCVVFVSGPGYLELPWATETSLRLKNSGAEVLLCDLSQVAERYAMRLTLSRMRLPVCARRLLRYILFQKNSRAEILMGALMRDAGIPIHYCGRKVHAGLLNFLMRSRRLSEYKDLMWANVSAFEILRTVMSNRDARLVGDSESVPVQLVTEIKQSILEAADFCETLLEKNEGSIDHVFVVNGRQPVQAAVTLFMRSAGIPVTLSEGWGGYMYPSHFSPRIDYFRDSPHSFGEAQEKIIDFSSRMDDRATQAAIKFRDLMMQRQEFPYGLNFLQGADEREFEWPNGIKGKRISFFISSEWELSVIHSPLEKKGSGPKSLFSSQVEAIRGILSCMYDDDVLVIRDHPMDPGKATKRDSEWRILTKDPRVRLVHANDALDSYRLGMESDVCFVWTSTIGLELMELGKEVCVTGPAMYAPLAPESLARCVTDVAAWLSKPSTTSKSKLLPYFGYFAVGGYPFEYTSLPTFRAAWLQSQEVDRPRRIFHKLPTKLFHAIS